MGIWDGIESAEIFERGQYFKPEFTGVVEVKRTIAKNTRAKGLAFIVELLVLETNLPDQHPIGQKGSWYQKMVDKSVAFPAVKAWAAACIGIDPHRKELIEQKVNPIIKELMEYATDNPDNNDFVGVKLRLNTVPTKKRDGGDFTRYDFAPYGAVAAAE